MNSTYAFCDNEFYKAKISTCIQQADIHISFLAKNEAIKKNKDIIIAKFSISLKYNLANN